MWATWPLTNLIVCQLNISSYILFYETNDVNKMIITIRVMVNTISRIKMKNS